MKWRKFTALLTDGRPHWDQPREKARAFRTLDGHEVDIWIRPKATKQGTPSMRYYRGVVIPDIATACGYDEPEDFERVHESLAWKFLRLADDALGFPRRRSTSKGDLTQAEMTAYIDQVITHAETTIVGCRVRRPEEIDDWTQVYEHPFDDAA